MAGQGSEPEVYEVFVQRDHASPHVHVGNVLAAAEDMALLLARENFLRRDPAVNVWVTPRRCVAVSPYGGDFFARETDKSYRLLTGYRSNNERWRQYRQRMLELKELVRD